MKFTLAFLSTFFSTATLLKGASGALLDCDTEIKRAASDPHAGCAHFDGVDAHGYRKWYDDNGIETKYPSMVYLLGSDPNHPENGAAVHWKVDEDNVHIAVAARATGWVGFGIGDAGGMLGADLALFTAASPTEIVDAYTDDDRYPQTDDCSADWELLASHIDDENGFIMFEMKRLLDTGDHQDKRIVNDASLLMPHHRIIAAWGDTTQVSYHGLNRARGAIRFYGSGDEEANFKRNMDTNSEGSFLIGSENYEIPAEDTTYAYACISRQALLDQGVPDTQDMLNMIGFEPVIEEGHEAYVHHYIIYGSPDSCEDGDFSEVVFVWAPGEGSLTLPDHLGAPMFGEDGHQAFEIEIHYNNPLLTEGIIDNSGVRVYWTSEPREEQVGVLSVGDPSVELEGMPVGDGPSVHTFECPGSCSSHVNKTVHVLREYLHAHQTGARMVNQQIRDGEVIRTGSLEYWEFDQNGNAAVQQDAFDIVPGDGFRTTCYYDGSNRVFGLASSQEMCMAFLYYYPRQKLHVPSFDVEFPWYCSYDLGFDPCETSYSMKVLSSVKDFGRTFGVAEDECPATDDAPSASPTDSPKSSDDNSGSSRAMVSHRLYALLVVATVAGWFGV